MLENRENGAGTFDMVFIDGSPHAVFSWVDTQNGETPWESVRLDPAKLKATNVCPGHTHVYEGQIVLPEYRKN